MLYAEYRLNYIIMFTLRAHNECQCIERVTRPKTLSIFYKYAFFVILKLAAFP